MDSKKMKTSEQKNLTITIPKAMYPVFLFCLCFIVPVACGALCMTIFYCVYHVVYCVTGSEDAAALIAIGSSISTVVGCVVLAIYRISEGHWPFQGG
jgi:hypothetical protein